MDLEVKLNISIFPIRRLGYRQCDHLIWKNHTITRMKLSQLQREHPSLSYGYERVLQRGFSGTSSGKEAARQCRIQKRRDASSIPASGRSLSCSRKWKPTPVFLLEKFHFQRSLAGYGPWGCKESGMTEYLNILQQNLCPSRR